MVWGLESKELENKTQKELIKIMQETIEIRRKEMNQLYRRLLQIDCVDDLETSRKYVYIRDVAIAKGIDTYRLNFPKSIGECKW